MQNQNVKNQMKQIEQIEKLYIKIKALRNQIFEQINMNGKEKYVTAQYDDIAVGDRVYFMMGWKNGQHHDVDIGQYPFLEFKNKGAHHDPLGGWFTNPENKKLLSEYPKTYKLGRYEIEDKIKFEEKSKAFCEKFFDGTNKIIFV